MRAVVASTLFSFTISLLVGCGLVLWYRTYGTLLLHAALLVTLPSYVASAATSAGMPMAGCWTLGVAAALAVAMAGAAITIGVFEPVRAGEATLRDSRRRRIGSKTGILLGSLGLYTAGVAATRLAFDGRPRLAACGLELSELSADWLAVVAAGLAVALYAVLVTVVRAHGIGLLLRAVVASPDGAAAYGFDGAGVARFATLAGALLLATGGIMVGAITGVTPDAGFRWILAGASAMIVGGSDLQRGLFPGLAAGSATVAVVVTSVTYWVGSIWADAVLFAVLVALLLWRPQGLFPGAQRR